MLNLQQFDDFPLELAVVIDTEDFSSTINQKFAVKIPTETSE
jgi:hypothetical protein